MQVPFKDYFLAQHVEIQIPHLFYERKHHSCNEATKAMASINFCALKYESMNKGIKNNVCQQMK